MFEDTKLLHYIFVIVYFIKSSVSKSKNYILLYKFKMKWKTVLLSFKWSDFDKQSKLSMFLQNMEECHGIDERQ
jgi:hypothetical protein